MNSNISQHTFFDGMADMWDQHESGEKLERLERIFSRLRIKIQKRALDVGSGTGILVPVIIKYADPAASVWEYDFSRRMLSGSKKRWSSFAGSLFHINGDSHYLPFCADSFDFVICFAVLPHLTEREQAIREWYRVLSPGGKLLILHLMSSSRLNQMHAETDPAVQNDYLPPVDEVASTISSLRFSVRIAQEEDDLYLLLSEK
jgi:ubiquinone/menaquinone biosynthesis C-methylase UbiE